LFDSLSDDQARAEDAVEAFLRRPGGRQSMSVQGLAGTGKTHLLGRVATRHPELVLGAPTGKAASVLRGRTGLNVSTCHSLIYDFVGLADDETDPFRKRPMFADKEDAGLKGRVVGLDESSMIGCRLAEDVLATGARVIAFGDPGQLGPVADDRFFDTADVTLRTIHRQALESAVVRQAHAIRGSGRYGADGADFRVVARATDDDLRAADVALCWKNATRRALNARRRAALGVTGAALRAGEPVMILRNDHARGVFNGETYPLARGWEPGDDLAIVAGDRTIELMNPAVEGYDVAGMSFEEARHDESYTPVALAYAVTVHKAQGSEWSHVLVVDEFRGAEDERRGYLYTGVTRAAKRAVVVRPGQ
jgi:exodeoxyribonuclease-5